MNLLKRQSGFSLLEIMIAVMILAIGLLGMAAMQAVALSSNQEAQFRIQALAIAEDLASRMRTNRAYINVSRSVYTNIPADHAGFNVYSVDDTYNSSPSNPIVPTVANFCANPSDDSVASSLLLNCRASRDVDDIRRLLKPDDLALADNISGRLLPPNSLMHVSCSDRVNLDYTGAEDTDPCSPGSVYTIYVFWPISSSRTDAGQVAATATNNNLNSRCVSLLTGLDTALDPSDYGCVIMDLIP